MTGQNLNWDVTPEASRKTAAHMLLLVILAMAVFLTANYFSNGGQIVLTERPLDIAALDDPNPIRVKDNIEAATSCTATVTGFSQYSNNPACVYVRISENPNVEGFVYLSRRDAAMLDIGDVITVHGRFQYKPGHPPSVVIGSSIYAMPAFLPAVLNDVRRPAGTFGGGRYTR